MPLSGLECLRSHRDQNTSNRIYILYHKTNRPTGARSDQRSAEQLDRNFYKLIKWRSSSDIGSIYSDSRKVVNNPCTNIFICNVDQALVPQELSAHLRTEALVEEAGGSPHCMTERRLYLECL